MTLKRKASFRYFSLTLTDRYASYVKHGDLKINKEWFPSVKDAYVPINMYTLYECLDSVFIPAKVLLAVTFGIFVFLFHL